MTDRRLLRLAPVALLLLLAAAALLPIDDALRLESGDEASGERFARALDELPDDAVVLVAFDPDLGTYAEIRPAVRTALADLLEGGAGLALVSITPEGRALGVAELARLERAGANPRQIADLGFQSGAEAALVGLTRAFPEARTDTALGRTVAENGFDAVDALLVIGGNDLGPRSWVEQVLPRTDDRPVLAITPAVLLPEVAPYTATGQLDALLATPRDGASYREAVSLESGERLATDDGPSVAALLVGTVVALLVLGQALLAATLRAGSERGR